MSQVVSEKNELESKLKGLEYQNSESQKLFNASNTVHNEVICIIFQLTFHKIFQQVGELKEINQNLENQIQSLNIMYKDLEERKDLEYKKLVNENKDEVEKINVVLQQNQNEFKYFI